MIKSIVVITIVFLCFLGCGNPSDHNRIRKLNEFEKATDKFYHSPHKAEIITIDGCEYIVWGGSHNEVGFTHKGNCKFCLRRLR